MKNLITAFLAGIFAFAAQAQEYSVIPDSTVLGQNYGYATGTPRPDLADNPEGRTPPGRVDFVFETALFLKNLEIGGQVSGETFIGFLSPVRFRYRVHEQVTVEAGAVLGHNFGDDNELDVAEPLVRLVYEPITNLFIIGGTILPTHWIHDALFDDVQKFRGPTEQGAQIRADRVHWKNDLWLNWRERESDENPEEFEVGNSTQGRWGGFRGDAQFFAHHFGGQINSSGRVENRRAYYGGGSFGTQGTRWADDLALLEDLRVHGGYFYSTDDTPQGEDGSGWEIGAYADIRAGDHGLIRPFASYFCGDDFHAFRGDVMYSNYDQYTQSGVNTVWRLPAGLRAEIGFTLQLTGDGKLNNTYQMSLVWGRGFGLWQPQ
jgi:hypothetical protein